MGPSIRFRTQRINFEATFPEILYSWNSEFVFGAHFRVPKLIFRTSSSSLNSFFASLPHFLGPRMPIPRPYHENRDPCHENHHPPCIRELFLDPSPPPHQPPKRDPSKTSTPLLGTIFLRPRTPDPSPGSADSRGPRPLPPAPTENSRVTSEATGPPEFAAQRVVKPRR